MVISLIAPETTARENRAQLIVQGGTMATLLTGDEMRRGVQDATWSKTKKKPNGFETRVGEVTFLIWRPFDQLAWFWERTQLLAQRNGSVIGQASGMRIDILYDQVVEQVAATETKKQADKAAATAAAIVAANAREAEAAATQARLARTELFGRSS